MDLETLAEKQIETEIARAKRIVKEYSVNAEPEYICGVIWPQLPSVDDETLQALELLQRTEDIEYLAEIAAVLLRFAGENSKDHRWGGPIERNHVLVKVFVSEIVPGAKSWDEIDSSSLARWICENREKMGPSTLLDREIALYKRLARQQQRELKLRDSLGIALIRYAKEHDNNYPNSLSEVERYVRDETVLRWITDNVEYVGKSSKIGMPENDHKPLAYDRVLLAEKEGTNVLYADGHTRFVPAKELATVGIAQNVNER